MSLYCGQGREPIENRFFFIHYIGTLKEGLKLLISEDPEEYCPDCAVCFKHFSKVSKSKLLIAPDSIEGRIYAVASGASTPICS